MAFPFILLNPHPDSKLTLTTQFEEPFREKYASILDDARKYNFYPYHLQLFPMSPEFPGIYCYSSHKGWALVMQGMNPTDGPFLEVKYVFVYPDMRRKGFFRSLHNELLRTEVRICVCTNSEVMVRTLHALGYKLRGRSLDNRELNFVYTKHLQHRTEI